MQLIRIITSYAKYSFSFSGYRPIVLKNFQISFLLIKEGFKVFPPLRYENDLFIREIMEYSLQIVANKIY